MEARKATQTRSRKRTPNTVVRQTSKEPDGTNVPFVYTKQGTGPLSNDTFYTTPKAGQYR